MRQISTNQTFSTAPFWISLQRQADGLLDAPVRAAKNASKAIQGNAMPQDLSKLDLALEQAHLPDKFKPVYDFFTDSRLGGLSEEKQAEVKAFAKKVITDYFSNGEKLGAT